MYLLKHISDANDKPTKDITLGLFLDLSKAFDTINHSTLLSKLRHYGIRGVANDWFLSYLSNRSQFTEVNGTKSDTNNIICGVPQGSILGPILFLIYINDCTDLELLSFADDTTVYSSHHNIISLHQIVNTELTHLTDWFSANKLALNVKKTKYAIFSPPGFKTPNNLSLMINGIQLSRIGKHKSEQYIKFLGIALDENLTWKQHVKAIKSKLSRSLFAINRVKKIFPRDILKTLYFSLIQSHLLYGILTWGTTTSISQLEKMQKRAIRSINNAPYNSHTDPLFKSNNILKLTDMYKTQSSLFAHDCKNNNLPKSFMDYFTFNNNISTRQVNQVQRIRPRTKYTSLLPFHHIPTIWNTLSDDFTVISNRNKFKRTIKIYLVDQYPSQVHCTNPKCHVCHPPN